MLSMKANCERCNASLAPDSNQALICPFECTWCFHCNEKDFKGVCPSCGGDLQQRPLRKATQ